MIFRLDHSTGVPPYLQLVRQVKHALRTGALQPGDRLPTVKEVVAYLVINPNTVFKAYRELESMGLVKGRVGSGTFATSRPEGPSIDEQRQLTKRLQQWITEAIGLGFDAEAIETLVAELLQEQHKENTSE